MNLAPQPHTTSLFELTLRNVFIGSLFLTAGTFTLGLTSGIFSIRTVAGGGVANIVSGLAYHFSRPRPGNGPAPG